MASLPVGGSVARTVPPTGEELRYIVIGRIGDRQRSAVCTHRGQRIRIISVRRARKEEIDHYESQ